VRSPAPHCGFWPSRNVLSGSLREGEGKKLFPSTVSGLLVMTARGVLFWLAPTPPNAVPLSVQAAESFRYSFLRAAVLPCSPIITLCSHASLLYLSKVPASLSTRIARFIALSKTRRRGASVCGPEFRAVARVLHRATNAFCGCRASADFSICMPFPYGPGVVVPPAWLSSRPPVLQV
jgi:hypothetical protein